MKKIQKMNQEKLIQVLSKIRGAKTYLRPDKYSSNKNEVIFAYVECEIFNIELFEMTTPKFLLDMIATSKIREVIKSYNDIGKYGMIGRPIEVDVMVEEREFDGMN